MIIAFRFLELIIVLKQ